MTIETTAALVNAVAELGLLDGQRQRELADLGSRHFDLRDLLLDLRSRNWLSSFQVAQVIQGRGKKLVLGPHVVLDRLGTGGMGEVFKAVHRRMDRVVALKIIRTDEAANPATLHRFHREARAAAQFSHPNIVTVFDYAEENGVFYLSMEYLDGVDLARLLHREGPLPITVACEFARQAALGIEHAHGQGIIHRDIKPSNLFACEPPRPRSAADVGPPGVSRYAQAVVKILDMGLARMDSPDGNLVADITRQGIVVGTMDYIAPEQARDPRAVDRRCDIYSLGGTLYHLLTGLPPFPGGSPLDKVLRHQADQPTALTARRADASPQLAAVVAKMMAKRPEDRYSTAAEVAEALSAFSPRPPGSGVTGESDSIRTNSRLSGPRPTLIDEPVPQPTRIVALEMPGAVPGDSGTKIVDPPLATPGGCVAEPRGYPSTSSRQEEAASAPRLPAGRLPLVPGTAVIVLLLLAFSAAWWLPAPTVSPTKGFPSGASLAGVLPADAAGGYGFRPAKMFGGSAAKWLPGLEKMLLTGLPETPGIDPRSAASVKVLLLKGSAPRVVALALAEDVETIDWPSLVPKGPHGAICELPGRRGFFAARPPFVVASADRIAAELLAAIADGKPAGSADDRVRELAQGVDAGGDAWFFAVPALMGPPARLHLEFDDHIKAILEEVTTAEGGIVMSGGRLTATVRLTAENEDSADRLLKTVIQLKGFAADLLMTTVKAPALDTLRPALKLLDTANPKRVERSVTLETRLPAQAKERVNRIDDVE